MPSKRVPWIVLQVSCSTRTSRESLRPPKRPSKAKNGQNITFLDISGSVLSDFEVSPRSRMKYEKNAAFGSHVALSVLQIDLRGPGKSSSVHHYESGRNSSLFSLPCFLFYFLGDFWSETTQGTSMGRARIHFRGSWPIQGPFQPKKLAPALKYDFLPKPWKIQTVAITNPLRQTRGNRVHLKGPARSHCSHGRFDTWADVVRPTVPKLQPFSWNNFSKASSVETTHGQQVSEKWQRLNISASSGPIGAL